MPCFNRHGEVAAGVGGNSVLYNNVIIAAGGGAAWLDDDTIIFNGPDHTGRWVLQTYNVRTQAFQTLNPSGPNFLAAGGGRYAAQAGSYLYANFAFAAGSVMSLTGGDNRGAASRDGLVALCDDSNCTAFTIYAPDGSTCHVAAVAYELCLLGPSSCVWNGGAYGYDFKPPVPMARPRIIRDWLIGYVAKLGIVVVPNGQTDGYILPNTISGAFAHDAVMVGEQLLVCYALDPDEHTTIVCTVNTNAPRVPIVIPPDTGGGGGDTGGGGGDTGGGGSGGGSGGESGGGGGGNGDNGGGGNRPIDPFRTHTKGTHMADKIVVLRGPGGRLARPDALGTGPWGGQGWRGLVFDGTDKTDARYHFTCQQPDQDYALISAQTGGILGCDATIHSGGLNSQFYVKPDGNTDRGWAETFRIYDGNGNGAIEAQVEYGPGTGGDYGPFFSYPLAVETV